MRCIIARFPFHLEKSQVQESMKGIKPEPVTAESVLIGRRAYPIKQVGEVITGQDRRDFTVREVTTALTRLGFTCRVAPAPEPEPAARQASLDAAASVLFGTALRG
ncbi:SCO5918 family protein [Streptomyces sp. URMC 123]|uniref:SCO5918 family protein n=1 Tax=Streptomyces sp. URMC 123 TaxID=3423403 RepID=UPI003F1C4869